jgi:hypothetical protein
MTPPARALRPGDKRAYTEDLALYGRLGAPWTGIQQITADAHIGVLGAFFGLLSVARGYRASAVYELRHSEWRRARSRPARRATRRRLICERRPAW